ncbi:hypothetical protein M501DRAFT_942051 [Patellaria atrata CBS 101060]|uniref:BZIP transcription factor n=1 Tax=Patellaria atrata CBS 101060 TaxID=1346257 RepID=A0A9P4VJL7_9PEZI|nr:hypothetical protein M501DRAFT_942051 [Patellaria atrata CBS 101060]
MQSDNNEDQSDQNTKKRRRTSVNPSPRGVANLTPQQLERKRANDREAQRAIRERTKSTIEQLKARINKLESQRPQIELQHALREKEAIQAENNDIRSRLTAVLALIQPVLGINHPGTQSLNDLADAAERNTHSAVSQNIDAHDRVQRSYDHLASPDIHPALAAQSTSSPPSQSHGERNWAFPGAPPTSDVRSWPPTTDPALVEPLNTGRMIPPEPLYSDERLGLNFLLSGSERLIKRHDGTPLNSIVPINAPHLVFPKTIQSTCPLDEILLGCLRDCDAQAVRGVSRSTLAGPAYPNFSALIEPTNTTYSHQLSRVLTDILGTFEAIKGLPEQVAIIFIMFLVMRWLVDPTPENYNRLPDWVTPRAASLFTPHPAWIDYLPFPRLRDRMVLLDPFIHFADFFIPFTTTINLNWPHDPRDPPAPLYPAAGTTASPLPSASSVYTPTSGTATSPFSTAVQVGTPETPVTENGMGRPVQSEEEQWLINPAFEEHLRDLRNWSLGPKFRELLPGLADCVEIR